MFGTLIRITISVTVIVGNTAMLNLVEKRQFPHFSTGENWSTCRAKQECIPVGRVPPAH